MYEYIFIYVHDIYIYHDILYIYVNADIQYIPGYGFV